MRMRDHAVVFERDPGFARFLQDESGSVLQVLRVWALYPVAGAGEVRRYIGSVRRWEGRGWVSHRELLRLFRRATGAARYRGEDVRSFRAALGRFLREKLSETG